MLLYQWYMYVILKPYQIQHVQCIYICTPQLGWVRYHLVLCRDFCPTQFLQTLISTQSTRHGPRQPKRQTMRAVIYLEAPRLRILTPRRVGTDCCLWVTERTGDSSVCHWGHLLASNYIYHVYIHVPILEQNRRLDVFNS